MAVLLLCVLHDPFIPATVVLFLFTCFHAKIEKTAPCFHDFPTSIFKFTQRVHVNNFPLWWKDHNKLPMSAGIERREDDVIVIEIKLEKIAHKLLVSVQLKQSFDPS